jgi:hypothetical protein
MLTDNNGGRTVETSGSLSVNSLEKQSEVISKEIDDLSNIPEKLMFEERSSPEILKTYLKNLGCFGRRKPQRCISQELKIE